MRRLQSVQNAAARLITSAPGRDHITPILPATAPLATSTTTCQLQDRRPGFRVLDWSGTWLHGRGLSACRRRQRSPTSISSHSDLCHAPHVRHLRRTMLRSCRSTAVELAANQSTTVIIIIISTTMFMVLSSWQSHCESSPSVTVWNNSSVC